MSTAALPSRLFTAPVSAVTGWVRTGAQRAVGTGRQVVETPLHTAEKMAGTVVSGLAPLLPDHNSNLRDDLTALLDPRDRRAQRRVTMSEDMATIEVQGLDNGHRSTVTRALDQQLGRLRGVEWWRVNAVTGRIVTALSAGADLDQLLAVIEEVEQESEVADEGWSRAAEFPADREPVIAAAIEVAGDICAIAISAAGTVPPLRGVMHGVRAAAAFTDAQPRLRGHLEQRLGSARTDLLLAVANAAGAALGEGAVGGLSNLLADTVQRGFALTEAVARHAQWQEWQADIVGAEQHGVATPLPRYTRPVDLPRGPVERVADESAAASLAGAAVLAGVGRTGDVPDALLLGAPKTARAGREVFAATVATTAAAAGVLTLHPAVWRRFDRLTALVVDAEALETARRVVLETETTDEQWSAARVWSTAQRLLWAPDVQGDRPALRLVHPRSGARDRGATTRPVQRELRDGNRTVGRVLVGRELDARAHGVLNTARRAGLRVVLAGHRDAGELRGLADEFVSARGSLSGHVERLQRDGHVVAVLSTRAHKALDHADVAVGVIGCEGGDVHIAWSADLLCRDLRQVQRTLAAVTPARQVSERGRTLALSACTLTGLLLAARPATRSRTAPMIAANVAGLFNGALAGLGTRGGDTPSAVPAPLLPWHALEPDEVLSRLPAPADTGERDPGESGERGRLAAALVPLADYLGHMRRELADPLTPVLGVGAAATAILGAPSDAVLLSSVLTVNAMISARQRQAAENELHELIEGERLTGHVVARTEINTAEPQATDLPADCLEIGDVIAVRAGEVVPADARLLRTDELEMDESGLTGESVTVPKSVAATPGAALGDRSCLIFEGTTVVSGSAVAVVVAVGADTQAGRAAAGAVPPDKGGVQAQLRSLTDRALPLTLTGGGIVTALGALRGRMLRAAISDGVGVAVAAVPEGLPLVATVAQLAAARRLSRYGVLARANRAVEALGRVDELCFDKTGTLTEGRLRLTALADLEAQWEPGSESGSARRLLRAAVRACPEPDNGPVLHATDRAVLDAAADILGSEARRWDLLDEIPFESNRGYAAAFGRTGDRLRLLVKGAPEVVLPRCSAVGDPAGAAARWSAELRDRADAMIHELAEQGLRVLVVAGRNLPEQPADLEDAVEELTLLGFLGIADTPRPQTPYLVRALQDNGVGVRMITGDHPVTAAAVARQLGITVDTVTTGADLDGLDDTGQTALIERSNVFARVDPEQKVRIVAALRRSGHVVGMAGDGSNDAAAIRTADIGIGIAAHGSAAARNAADLVLTEPDPLVLLHALVEGRSMWQRVTDAVAVLVGGNAGEIAFTLFGTAVSGQAPLGTRQFLLVNLLTDMFPALALALADDRKRPEPQDGPHWVEQRAEQLADIPPARLGSDLIHTIAVRGVATATGASVAWIAGRYTGTPRRADTIGLVALIGTQLGQTLVAGYRSPLVWLTTAASGAVLGFVVMTPGLGTYFGCTPLGPVAWSIAITSSASATAGSVLLPRLLPAVRHTETGTAARPAAAANALTGPADADRGA